MLLHGSREQLLDEIEELRALLCNAGVCPDCREEIDHDIEKPFASCNCGTAEAVTVPMIADLRYKLHLTSYLLFKLTSDFSVSGNG